MFQQRHFILSCSSERKLNADLVSFSLALLLKAIWVRIQQAAMYVWDFLRLCVHGICSLHTNQTVVTSTFIPLESTAATPQRWWALKFAKWSYEYYWTEQQFQVKTCKDPFGEFSYISAERQAHLEWSYDQINAILKVQNCWLENQSSRDCKALLEIICSVVLNKSGSATAGCQGPCPVQFLVSPDSTVTLCNLIQYLTTHTVKAFSSLIFKRYFLHFPKMLFSNETIVSLKGFQTNNSG